MMITLNGSEHICPDGTTVAGLLAELGAVQSRGVAVAIDAEVVPRSAWETEVIADGARVEVLVAVQGG